MTFKKGLTAFLILLLPVLVMIMGESRIESRIAAGAPAPAPRGIYALAAVRDPGRSPLHPGRDEPIALWEDEDRDCYVLFMPAFALGDTGEGTVDIRFRGPKGAMIDGMELPCTISCSLPESGYEPAAHTVTTEGRERPLDIYTGSDLPAIFIHMEEQELEGLYETPYTGRRGSSLSIVDGKGVSDTYGLDTVRVRGNTSADWSKKPYQISLERPGALMGMGSARRWNLLSNWSDKSLIRNKITYDMAQQAGLEPAPESSFGELYINGSYQGCYQLCEKIEIENDRLDIRNLSEYTARIPSEEDDEFIKGDLKDNEDRAREYRVRNFGGDEGAPSISLRAWDAVVTTEDITGGYLLELERPSRIHSSASFFITSRGQPVTVKSPEYASLEETAYMAGLWQAFEDALFDPEGINRGNGRHYSEYIDNDSFAGKYLVEEISRNYDASSTSQYFYKDTDERDPLIHAGPVWDYDMSLGNPIMAPATNQHYISSVCPEGLFAALYMDEYSLWAALCEHGDFMDRVRTLYGDSYRPLAEYYRDEGIDELARGLAGSALMDRRRWDRDDEPKEALAGYRADVELLKSFLTRRERYLTGLWIEGREPVRAYISAGEADMYVSYVDGLKGDPIDEPPAPKMEGYRFLYWANGYDGTRWDFSRPHEGQELYLAAVYADSDGREYIALAEGLKEMDDR